MSGAAREHTFFGQIGRSSMPPLRQPPSREQATYSLLPGDGGDVVVMAMAMAIENQQEGR
jgi:hypothetical protein